MRKALKKKQFGFTLVEIMIVVAIIGLLAAIGIPSFMKAREKSLTNTKEANTKQVEGAIEQYALDNSATNDQSVGWADFADYMKDTDLADYEVGGQNLNTSTFVVGGQVTY